MEKAIRLPEVQKTVGASRSTIYTWLKLGRFPKPLKLGSRMIAWRVSDIERWLESKASER